MGTQQQTAAIEWRRHYSLPLVAALGYATSVIHIYGLGPYLIPITKAFGWSRTQAAIGLTLSTMVQAVFGIGIGLLVDRFGPRRFGVIGVVLTCGAFALLGTASGTRGDWLLHWGIIAVASLPIQATVWTSAVASRFAASRGLALAVTLCGASVATTVFPLLGTWLIGAYGWRHAFMIQGLIWVAIAFPPILLLFRGARDRPRVVVPAEPVAPATELAGTGLAEGVRSTIYLRLFVASLLFTFTIISITVHFVPILTDRGADPLRAAGTAAIIGIAAIVGRLSTGVLLDRLRASLVGAVVFALPSIGCLLLLFAGGNPVAQALAAATIGLTMGAEVDVMVYLTTRYFGLRSFGGLYGGLLCALSIGTSTGPLAAAAIFDHYGGYAPFLWLTLVCMIGSSAALASLPRPPAE